MDKLCRGRGIIPGGRHCRHIAVSGGWRGRWECGGEAEGDDED